MATSLIEIIVLTNFGHLTTSTIEFDSNNKVLLMSTGGHVILFYFRIPIHLTRLRIAKFADIIPIYVVQKTSTVNGATIARMLNIIRERLNINIAN